MQKEKGKEEGEGHEEKKSKIQDEKEEPISSVVFIFEIGPEERNSLESSFNKMDLEI